MTSTGDSGGITAVRLKEIYSPQEAGYSLGPGTRPPPRPPPGLRRRQRFFLIGSPLDDGLAGDRLVGRCGFSAPSSSLTTPPAQTAPPANAMRTSFHLESFEPTPHWYLPRA
jgi:hypothetical protein